MIAARLKNIFFSLLAVELISSITSFILCCFILHRYPHSFGDEGRSSIFYLMALFFLSLVSFIGIFYQKIVRFSSFHNSISWEGFFKAQATLLFLGLLFTAYNLWIQHQETANLLIVFSASSMIMIAVFYCLVSYYLRAVYNKPDNKLKVLTVGMNQRMHDFCSVLSNTPHLGVEIRGYLDEKPSEFSNSTYLGRAENLDSILRKEVIDVIFIFLPVRTFYDTIHKTIETSGFYGVTAYIVGNVFETENIKKQPLCINDFGRMAFSSTTADHVSLAIKRILDIVLSLVALIILSPILLAVGLYIKIVSPGPMFFYQERVGFNKRLFTMVKFRTMVPDAEARLKELAHLNEMDGPAFKITNDPRLIRGASFLRRHSIDELPQIWNVLMGDMSIVGPRPLSRRDFDLLQEDWQRKRFSMRPGLTCLWQIGGRNNVTFKQWMSMDLDYIDRWRLTLDFDIILGTLRAVVVGSGR